VDRSDEGRTRSLVPAQLATECSEIAGSIREQNQSIRYDKITAARVRMSSGYYDSGHVLRVIASRLLGDGPPR
jgi:hypothetical protein